jgi:osomolarity two-component system response regulator SKN7
MNNKDALDNIRRKAPTARKAPPPADDMLVPSHQIDMMNGQLVATQQQITTLQERNTELSVQCTSLSTELMNLKGFIYNHEQILSYVVNAVMSDYDKRARRQSRMASIFPGSGADVNSQLVMPTSGDGLHASIDDEAPPSPLLHASKLLSETNVEALMNNRNLEPTHPLLASPTPDLNGRASTGSAPPSAGSTGTIHFRDLDNIVYPVGANNGIDPMYGDHMNNIPYALPVSKPLEPPLSAVPTAGQRKANVENVTWLRPPTILLVEDDNTCRKIGTKFLSAYHCSVTAAVSLIMQ